MARRRIACGRACRLMTSRHVPYRPSPNRVPYDPSPDDISLRPARFGDLDVPAVFPVGHPEGPSSAMSRPNSACSRRRHRRFTNIYSFTWPWRSITVQSAARLRRALGRPHPVQQSPDGHVPIPTDRYRSAGKPAIHDAPTEP